MKTGTPRLVVGIVLTAVFGLGALRNLVVVPLMLAVDGPTPYVLGAVVGAVVAGGVLTLGVVLIVSGARQRRRYVAALRRPVIHGRF